MYSGIKSSRNGHVSVSYPMTDKKDQKEARIGAFRCGGGILDTGTASGIRKQFAEVWKRGNRKIGDIQAYMLLYSFSPNELNPSSPHALETAADLADAAIKKIYPDHPYTLVAQKDGKGGKIHVHATVCALNAKTLKACRGRQTSYQTVRDQIETEMEAAGIAIDYGKCHTRSEKKRQEKKVAAKKRDQGYSWTEDLTNRIHTALSIAQRFSELEEYLRDLGVLVVKKTKRSWTFLLAEAKDSKYNGRKARGDRLDPLFVPQQMRKTIDENYAQTQAQLPFSKKEPSYISKSDIGPSL